MEITTNLYDIDNCYYYFYVLKIPQIARTYTHIPAV